MVTVMISKEIAASVVRKDATPARRIRPRSHLSTGLSRMARIDARVKEVKKGLATFNRRGSKASKKMERKIRAFFLFIWKISFDGLASVLFREPPDSF
jgi:hypothetical protein